MAIQTSINQLLTAASAAGALRRFSPSYEKKLEAKELLGKAQSAKAGLEAIEKGLSEPNKTISKTELSDIQARTAQLNRDVYNAKISAKEGHPLEKYIKKGVQELPGQSEYTKVLSSIEANLQRRKEAFETGEQDRLRQTREALLANDPEKLNINRKKIDIINNMSMNQGGI